MLLRAPKVRKTLAQGNALGTAWVQTGHMVYTLDR